ncbi:RsiW-degrading membrane proteinase PrsW (M82 family) [Motilibacter peucedani]|uniref:RsiW-degrading membrane proteinase PrsW (M82 family) n=1 Tax=Motilibacter peucedani TaxID=598650 RepID=A0A420XPQ6_9ACTN|nr:PrsW family glutamic-type intramembrane protease [Motilibacter peucedani]RKS75261.1 RsiW-degrading membrane proteinase PrsW (M82 family) [Motilibacter peucedani]
MTTSIRTDQPRSGRPAGPPLTRAARHGWLLVLAIGSAFFVADERTLVGTQNPNFLPSVILLGAAAVPAAFTTFVYGRRLAFDVPVGTVWTTAVLGGLIGTVVAGSLEYKTLRTLGVLPMVGVAAIEEFAKLLLPAAVLFLRPWRRRADGLLLGVAAGAGFAALETMGYGMVTLLQSGGDIGAVQNLLLVRGILSPAGHMAWTGIAAAALWSAAAGGWSAAGVRRVVVAVVVVVGIHTAWDSVHTMVGYVVLAAVSLAVLTYVTHRIAVAEPVAASG